MQTANAYYLGNDIKQKGDQYVREIFVPRDLLSGNFIIDSLAEKAQAPALSKLGLIFGVIICSIFFSFILVCLPEIFLYKSKKS